MSQKIELPPQHMAFPAERVKQIQQTAATRQAAEALMPPAQRTRQPAGVAMPVTPEEAAQAPYPFAGVGGAGSNPNAAQGQPLPDGRVAQRHAHNQQRQDAAPTVNQQGEKQHNFMPGYVPRTAFLPPVDTTVTPSSTEPQVPNEMPGFTNPVSEDEAASIRLPSRFAYYGFKDVYVRPFKARQLAKLSRAHEEKALLPMVEAVSSVLSSSMIQGSLAHMLTIQDFNFVLYWLKLNSFLKGSYLHTTACMDPQHHQDIKEGRRKKESLKITEYITKTNLVVTEWENIPDPAEFNFGPDSDFFLYPATMQDTLEFMDHPSVNDKEFQYFAQLASFVRHKEYQLTFNERVEVVKDFSGDHVHLIQRFEKLSDSYGVNEKITVRCKECGASRVTKMTLDAHSFLSA